MYGLSDHANGMPVTRFNAERHGSMPVLDPHRRHYRTYVRIRSGIRLLG